MIQWLQNYSGIKSSGENIEKTELENLRKEIKRYKKILIIIRKKKISFEEA